MSRFTGPLTLTHLDQDWRAWRLETPLVYEVGELGSGREIAVPPGFETDGASVPRLLWAFLPSWGSYSRAAVVHDYGCVLLHRGMPHPEMPDRATCDRVFLEAMAVCGTGLIVRTLMYAAVRAYARLFPDRPLCSAESRR